MVGSITVPTNGSPTPPDKKGWVWGAWSYLGMGIATSVAALVFPMSALVSIPLQVGAGVGGFMLGKKSGEQQAMQEIATNQKVVKEPSYLNAKLAEGYIKGAIRGAAIGGVAVLASLGLMFVPPPLAAGVLLVGGLAAAVVNIGSIIMGARNGKNEMTVEYQKAEEYQRSQAISQAQGVSRQRTEPAVEYNVPDRTQGHLQEQMARRANTAAIQKA